MKLLLISAILALFSQVALGCKCIPRISERDKAQVYTQVACAACSGKINPNSLECDGSIHSCFATNCKNLAGLYSGQRASTCPST